MAKGKEAAPKTKGKVGGQEGNKNAEKWTEETVLVVVEDIVAYFKNGGTPFLGSALMHFDLDPNLWGYWTGKFSDNRIVLGAIKKAERYSEASTVEGLLKGNLNAAGCIFKLKNKHDWEDKKTVDSNVKAQVETIMPKDMTPEERDVMRGVIKRRMADGSDL